MKRQKLRLSLTTLATALLIGLSASPAVGAATGPGNALRVSPVRTDLTISPGQSQNVNLTLTNVSSETAVFQTIVNDFTASSDESGNPALILDPTQYASSHSLKRYIVQPTNDITIGAGQEVSVPITINIPKNAAGGGYYAAVRFAPAAVGGNSHSTVSLAGSVGSLILVKVPGNIKEQLNIVSFNVSNNKGPSSFFTTNKNLQAVLRIENLGNIQEEPFGKILLRNRSGKILNTFEVNSSNPPGNVLPDSIRRFTVPISKVGSFGEYKIEGNFGYGSSGQLLSASTTFYVVPLWLILAFVFAVLLLAFLIFGLPRLIKAYNRRVLRSASRR